MTLKQEQGVEIGFFKRKNGVSEEELLLVNKEMEDHFLRLERHFLRHYMIKISENLYADVTLAATKYDAKQICSKWLDNNFAQSFLNMIEVVKIDPLDNLTFADVLSQSRPQIETQDLVHEIVSFEFRQEVTLEDQKNLMMELNHVVKKLDGFQARNYYYSNETNRWMDIVVWTDFAQAQKALDQIMTDSKAALVFSKIDKKTMIFSHYNWVNGVEKK